MKIYTKKGDSGRTYLAGGEQVSKSHIRIKAYGTVDELNSCIGVAMSLSGFDDMKETLRGVQSDLFAIGAQLAARGEPPKKEKVQISEERIAEFEGLIDKFMEEAGPLKSFVLPGGTVSASFLHLARAVCRRAETLVTELSEGEPVNPLCIKYLNRLSDLLFAMARAANKRGNTGEVKW